MADNLLLVIIIISLLTSVNGLVYGLSTPEET